MVTGTTAQQIVDVVTPAAGEAVTVGQVIARIAVGDADSVSTVPSNGNGGAPEADANGGNRSGDGGSAVATADGGATGDDLASGKLVDVLTPAAGESVTEGTILEWRANVGDFIKESDTIVEISTDKVDVELPAPASGTISELLVAEGDTGTVGQVI